MLVQFTVVLLLLLLCMRLHMCSAHMPVSSVSLHAIMAANAEGLLTRIFSLLKIKLVVPINTMHENSLVQCCFIMLSLSFILL